MSRTFVIAAAVLAFIGVGLGAFGAHALSAHFDANPSLEATYHTGTQYHIYHALALLGAAWAYGQFESQRKLIRWAGIFFIAGIVLFSGSLYLLAIFNLRWMGAIAPFGGASFLAGWALIAAAAFRSSRT